MVPFHGQPTKIDWMPMCVSAQLQGHVLALAVASLMGIRSDEVLQVVVFKSEGRPDQMHKLPEISNTTR